MNININTDLSRERSLSSSKYKSRKLFILSKAFSILYYKKMEIQSNNLLWNKQVKAEENAQSSSSHIKENNNSNNPETSNGFKYRKQCKVNEAPALNNILPPHEVSCCGNH